MTTTNPSLVLASGYSTADQPGIHAFHFDETTGALTSGGSFTGINAPSFLVVHPNKNWIYAVSETGEGSHGVPGTVWAFQLEREPFSLRALNQQSSGGDWPCHLQLDRSGRWLVATNYGTGNAAVYPLLSDGSLGEMTDFVQHQGKGTNAARQEGPHAHSSIFTPDNRFAIIADLGIDQVVLYRFDSDNGKLLPNSSVNARAGSGPRHFAFHPNDRWLYAANELNSTVAFYEFEAEGTLKEEQVISTIPFDAPENSVADIHISAEGDRLYVSNRGHNSIAVFDIFDNGSLTLVSIPSCGGNWPRNFALSPDGKFALVANQYSHELCVLPIREGREALGEPVTRASVTGASCVQFV